MPFTPEFWSHNAYSGLTASELCHLINEFLVTQHALGSYCSTCKMLSFLVFFLEGSSKKGNIMLINPGDLHSSMYERLPSRAANELSRKNVRINIAIFPCMPCPGT